MQSSKKDFFKKEILPLLSEYEITYRDFQNGDFGDLEQVIIESKNKGGGIDFWSSGWLGIDLYDYEKDEVLMNILIEADEEYIPVLEKLKKLLEFDK